MKKTAILFSLTLCSVMMSYGQTGGRTKQEEVESNCYLKWVARFEERGAEDVEDGTYADVVITFRNGSTADCINGKVDVKDGKVLTMYLRLEDGSYEQVKRKWKYEIKDVTVRNGMSKTLITADDELINVLFIKKIKPKKKGYDKAPVPSDY